MTTIWQGRFDKKPGTTKQCRESVYERESGNWMGSHQCPRKPVVFRCVNGTEYGFCKQHDPEAVAARGKARQEQWRTEREACDLEYDRQKQIKAATDACIYALEQIASGHNDPRTLALETLKLFP